MISLLEDGLRAAVTAALTARWVAHRGRVVPEPLMVALTGGAVELDCTVLYADLAASSTLVTDVDRRTAAKVMKSFLACGTRLIMSRQGTVTSFDGDRVMGVFVGDRMCSRAIHVGLQLNFAVQRIIAPRVASTFSSVTAADIRHAVGIDAGVTLAVRSGHKGTNDLIWIGRAPNFAAWLSEQREAPYRTFISSTVYNMAADEVKFGADGAAFWERVTKQWLGETYYVYRSQWVEQP